MITSERGHELLVGGATSGDRCQWHRSVSGGGSGSCGWCCQRHLAPAARWRVGGEIGRRIRRGGCPVGSGIGSAASTSTAGVRRWRRAVPRSWWDRRGANGTRWRTRGGRPGAQQARPAPASAERRHAANHLEQVAEVVSALGCRRDRCGGAGERLSGVRGGGGAGGARQASGQGQASLAARTPVRPGTGVHLGRRLEAMGTAPVVMGAAAGPADRRWGPAASDGGGGRDQVAARRRRCGGGAASVQHRLVRVAAAGTSFVRSGSQRPLDREQQSQRIAISYDRYQARS